MIKSTLYVAIFSLMLLNSRAAYSQTVSASDIGSGNADIYKTIKQKVYGFSISSTGGNATLTALTTQPTGGNYTATDIISFELYFNTVDNFASASLVGTSGLPAGFGESLNFNAFSQDILDDGSDQYFYIAANVAAGATSGTTFSIPFLNATNFTFSALVTFTPVLGSSGTKTIQDQLPFITTWKTDNIGSTDDNQIYIPAYFGGGYSYDIYWEEVGNPSNNGTEPPGRTGSHIITFPSIGTYRVEISGLFPRIFFNGLFSFNDQNKILSVEQWGDIAWTSMNNAFAGCENLRINATDAPDLSGVTDMSRMLYYASSFNDNINHWDVSSIENMSELFKQTPVFNQPLNTWDVSNVTNMREMFSRADAFNQDIKFVAGGANTGGDAWNVSNVLNMSSMFESADDFNQDIGNWNVSNVTNMERMFSGTLTFNQNITGWTLGDATVIRSMFSGTGSFNQDISGWNTTGVTDMSFLFNGASAFNQDISGWDIASVTNMSGMFSSATAFDQDISGWLVGGVTNMSRMFSGAIPFSADITGWNVSGVTNMSGMFSDNITFNQDISGWIVDNVLNMEEMFARATSFNQDISGWNVTNVNDMSEMFVGATSFNQDIGRAGGWDVSGVSDMRLMFENATSFDQDLSGWDVTNLNLAVRMFDNSGLSVSNYDKLLEGWSALPLRSNVSFGAQGIFYCSAQSARDILTGTFNWNITDGGPNCITLFAGTDTSAPQLLDGQPTPYDFGSINLGTPKTRSFTIQNQQSIPITNVVIALTGSAFTTPTPGLGTIAAGGTHTFTVDLSSASTGTFNETLSITSDNFPGVFSFPLTGKVTATPEPEIVIFDVLYGDEIINGSSTLDFSSEFRGNNIFRSITISNIGSTDLNLTNIAISGTVFSLASAPPTSIAADNSITLDLILDGTVAGTFYETLTITNDDTDESIFNFGLVGEIYGPDIAVYDGTNIYADPEIFDGQIIPIDFGSGPDGVDILRPFTIANLNQVDLNISTITITGIAFTLTSTPPTFVAAEVDGVISFTPFFIRLSGSIPGAYTETVTIFNDDDDEPTFTFQITGTIGVSTCNNLPTVDAGTNTTTCAGSAVMLIGTIGGSATTATWTSSGTGTFDDPTNLTPTYTPGTADETSGSVTLTLTVAASGPCPQVQDQMVLTIPTAITAGSPSVQSNVGQNSTIDVVTASTTNPGDVLTVTITQTATQGTVSVNPDNTINYIPNAGTVGSDSFEYQICNDCGLCDMATVAITILNAPPTIAPPSLPITAIAGQSVTIPFASFISDLNNNIDLNSIKITDGPTSNAIATFSSNFDLTLDYSSTPFAGTDEITIEVCDLLNVCSSIVMQVEVDGEIIVHNGVSPNGDDKNDYFKIQNIQFLEPQNRVSIYNRWGDKIYDLENYDSDNPDKRFNGVSDNGKELPSGVYFYKVEFQSGREELSGYLTLKK